MEERDWFRYPPTWRDGPIFCPSAPSVSALCYALYGWCPPKGVFSRPPLSERYRIFDNAMRMVDLYGRYEELTILALYRREVTNVGSAPEIDGSFFALIKKGVLLGRIHQHDLCAIIERLPPRSAILWEVIALRDDSEDLRHAAD